MFILCGSIPPTMLMPHTLKSFKLKTKQAPNFTSVEDLILCKLYAALSVGSTVGTDQTVETFWGKIFESFIHLSETEASIGTFYKWRENFICTIQPAMNVFNKFFCNVKSRKISANSLHKMQQFDPMTKPSTLRLADNSVVSKGEVNNLASSTGSLLAYLKGVKAANSCIKVARLKHMTTTESPLFSIHVKNGIISYKYCCSSALKAVLCRESSKNCQLVETPFLLPILEQQIENEESDGQDIEADWS